MVGLTVNNPIETLLKSMRGIISRTKTAIIEISTAAGITLIDDKDRKLLTTATCSVGKLILDAITKGAGNLSWDQAAVLLLMAEMLLGFEFFDTAQSRLSSAQRVLRIS